LCNNAQLALRRFLSVQHDVELVLRFRPNSGCGPDWLL